jgi:hypothetical protein
VNTTLFYSLLARVKAVKKPQALALLICNDTRLLVDYRHAALLAYTPAGQMQLVAHSGHRDTDSNTPYARWLSHVAKEIAPQCIAFPENASAMVLTPAMLSEPLAREWDRWLPAHIRALPLTNPDGQLNALLLLARDTPWTEQLSRESGEYALYHLAQLYGYAWWSVAARPGRLRQMFPALVRKRISYALILLMMILLIPIREYTLAPAEVISLNSEVVATPADGVIRRILVPSNAPVIAGQVLAELDDTNIKNRLAQAQTRLKTAEIMLQQANSGRTSNAERVLAEEKWREQHTEVAKLQREQEDMSIRAPGNGVFVYSDPDGWPGRPVLTGERIGMLADPSVLGIRAWAPATGHPKLSRHAPITVFLEADPLHPLTARLDYAGDESVEAPNGVASYLLRGTLSEPGLKTRPGLQGTARITGSWSLFGYVVFRRPLATLRAWWGS